MIEPQAVWHAALSGAERAASLLLIAGLAMASHDISRGAFRESRNPFVTGAKVLAVAFVVAALAALTLGQVRDCSEWDGLWVGCSVIDAVPVSGNDRWESFVSTLLFIIVPAAIGGKSATRANRDAVESRPEQLRTAGRMVGEWVAMGLSIFALLAILDRLLPWSVERVGWLSIVIVPLILMFIALAVIGLLALVFWMRGRSKCPPMPSP